MKVAVIGSHGTGKTTLCKDIAKALKDFTFIPDVVPDAFKLGFTINEKCPPETQFWILSKQLELERNTPGHWVMEKSLWDNIVYGNFSIKSKKVLEVIRQIVNKNINYDLLFYLPIEFPIPDDGLRSLNVDYQKAIDRGLKRILSRQKTRVITLAGDRQKRLDKALSVIRRSRHYKSVS